MPVDVNEITIRASLAQSAVLDGIVQQLTVGGDEVVVTWAHLEEQPLLNVTDVAIAGIRAAGRALWWVLNEHGSDEASRMVVAMQRFSELDLSAARRATIRLEQDQEGEEQ